MSHHSPSPSSQSASPEATALYGADAAGLVCGYAFTDGTARPLDAAQAAGWLGAPPATGFVWLHFNLSHAQAARWIERHAALPDEFFEALREQQPSSRIERADDALVAVLNDVPFQFDFEPTDIATLWIGLLPRLVLTARTRPLRSVDALRTAANAGRAPHSPTTLLEQLLRAQADGLVQIVRGVSARIDAVEDALLTGRLDAKRARLGALRRLLVRLQRLLAPEPAALFRLLQNPPAWMDATDAQDLRGATEEFSVVLRDMQDLKERIKLLQEEIAAAVNEGNNKSLFVLTVVTVFALPINILAGLFGMNVGGIPWGEHPAGFWIVLAIVAGFTAIAAWLAVRMARR